MCDWLTAGGMLTMVKAGRRWLSDEAKKASELDEVFMYLRTRRIEAVDRQVTLGILTGVV